MKKHIILLFAAIILSLQLSAKVSLPSVFADHMVMQQKSQAAFWGWASPLEEVTVITGWNGKKYTVKADNHANWKVTIETPAAGGPHEITVIGSNTLVLHDVLIGEVWVCSGQSNMEWTPRIGIDNGTQEILEADYPGIRFFSVGHRSAPEKQIDCAGEWVKCSPETMIDFSAVGYFFGRELHKNLNIPIGLINTSWGGTPAEAWTNPAVIEGNEFLKTSAAKLSSVPWCPVEPGSAYNSMLAPIIPYAIAGAIWYQGEGNTANYEAYSTLFPAMIQNWRTEWSTDFPFYYVQIAPFRYGKTNEGALIREAQLKSLSTPNTGMVVVSDIGNIENIHPRNKVDVGKRLAGWALSETYGKEGITYSGPIYKSISVEKNKIRVFFDFGAKGLIKKGEALTNFQIAGDDKKFVDATAAIDGSTVIVSNAQVKNPVAVRFAFSNIAEPNLFNAEGLPASCFRSDDWEVEVVPVK